MGSSFSFLVVSEEYTLNNIYGKNCVSGYIIYCFRVQTSKKMNPPPGNDHNVYSFLLCRTMLIHGYNRYIINNDLNYNDNCKMKCSSFISSFNKLHCNYANVQPCILFRLVNLWNFSLEGF